MPRPSLAIHGGAGTILRSEMTEKLEVEYRTGLQTALDAGWAILSGGGSALDAVEASVIELENFPFFNAGRGAVFTNEGLNELDASVMDGHLLKAGAVALVKNVKNPIKLARLVMERTEHILLAGDGANRFAEEMNVEFAEDPYFFTDHRYQQLLLAREDNVVRLDHSSAVPVSDPKSKIGTVGAVACDVNGNLAAATSTGGMTNKKFGRIGDTPLIGSGTYADNNTCAVSCTGHGEYFILGSTAFDVSARMRYKGLSLAEAAGETISRLSEIGGDGGFIAVDRLGNLSLVFNSDGMYRGTISSAGSSIDIYGG